MSKEYLPAASVAELLGKSYRWIAKLCEEDKIPNKKAHELPELSIAGNHKYFIPVDEFKDYLLEKAEEIKKDYDVLMNAYRGL